MITNFTDNQIWNSIVKVYGLGFDTLSINSSKIYFSYTNNIYTTAPYASYGGVIINNKLDLNEIVNQIINLYKNKKLKYILLKTDYDYFNDFKNIFFCNLLYSTFILDLSIGIDRLWIEKLDKKTRNQVRKGLNQNIDVKFGHYELLKDYYLVISNCWRDLGTPTHSFEFHKSILHGFKSDCKIIVIYYKNKPVSAALLIIQENTIHHPFAGTIKKYNSMSLNNVLYWKIIEFACEKKLKYWDMGRSPKQSGGAKYKLSWGAEEKQLYYYYLTDSKSKIPNYSKKLIKIATYIWKFIPLILANKLGYYFIKNEL